MRDVLPCRELRVSWQHLGPKGGRMNNTTDEECFQDYNKNVYQVRDEKTRRYLISICRDLLSKPKTK